MGLPPGSMPVPILIDYGSSDAASFARIRRWSANHHRVVVSASNARSEMQHTVIHVLAGEHTHGTDTAMTCLGAMFDPPTTTAATSPQVVIVGSITRPIRHHSGLSAVAAN